MQKAHGTRSEPRYNTTMITALILTDRRDGMEGLAATLAALVAGVAEGLVADAVVLSLKDDPEVAAVAEGVGAAHVAADRRTAWSVGARLGRRDWLLCLEAGDVPLDGWIGAVAAYLAETRAPALARARRVGWRRPGQALEALLGAGEVRPGDLVHRALLTDEGLSRRVRPARLDRRIRPPRRPG